MKQRAQSGKVSTRFHTITIPAAGWSLNTIGVNTFRTGTNSTALAADYVVRTTDSLNVTAPSGTLGLQTTGGSYAGGAIIGARVDTASSVVAGVQTAGVIAVDIAVFSTPATGVTLASGQLLVIRAERRE